jgi:hypothetical protein
MTPLDTERLTIRNSQASDWEALHEMIVQYESSELAAYDQQFMTDTYPLRIDVARPRDL